METLTPELKHAVEQAGNSPVRLMDLRYAQSLRPRQRRGLRTAPFGRRGSSRANRVSPGRERKTPRPVFWRTMIERGEIYLADFDGMEPHPVVVVSREELNRGNWVAAVLITSKRFEERSKQPHCLQFGAGSSG